MSIDFLVTNLRCEYMINPLGIDVSLPRLSWVIVSDRRGARQTAYQIVVSEVKPNNKAGAILWDSGKVFSDQSVHVEYRGETLQSMQRAMWKVRVWDEFDHSSDWSIPAYWEVGLLQRSDWRAKWIGANLVGGPRTSIPCPYFRKEFEVPKGIDIVHARLYVTALGVYQLRLNGNRVGEDELNPGWTDFNKRVRYRVYDVSDLVSPGENAIGAILGDGWYCGNLETRGRQLYGDRPKLLAQLKIDFSDETSLWVFTDESWKTAFGPLLEADLLMGESYDARLEFPGWDLPRFLDTRWLPVEVFSYPDLELVATNGPTIKAIQELKPISDPVEIPRFPASSYIFDMGQNMVGRVRIKVCGPSGTTIAIRHAEMLNPDGILYTANLRTARQTDYYTLRGGNEEVYEPHFTFHGFRYVELVGFPGIPNRDTVTGVVLHSDITPTGFFECSDSLVNQLQHNIIWSQKGNYLDVPTDCPQRDERLGWTGDAQVFVRTGAFNYDVAAFFTKWQQDLADAQHPMGAIPPVVPSTNIGSLIDGGPAWADAVIICPWTIYLNYGDKRILERYYQNLTSFIDFLLVSSQDLIRCSKDRPPKDTFEWLWEGFGDWLALDGSGNVFGGTPKDLIGTAFFAYSTRLVAKIAQVLGKEEDAKRYQDLFEKIRQAYIRRYVTADGLVIGQTQTAYVLSLYFDLLPEEARPKVIQSLVRDIESRKMHLATGFVGTPYLPHVLTQEGHLETAYQLLFQKTWPSWLYPVTQGATTIWERWDGWTQEKGFQDPGMNSFNHYAYGSIGAWMYSTIGGIDVDSDNPGYKHFYLRPRPGGGVAYATAFFDSIYGRIGSSWKIENGSLYWDVTVPANTTATAFVPADGDSCIQESGNPIDQSEGVTYVRREPDAFVYKLVSGSYHFSVEPYRIGL